MPNVRLFSALIVLLILFRVSAKLPSEDYHVLSKYYGFDEMEIIKLDSNIQNLISAKINSDSMADLAVANNYKSRIDILLQNPEGVETEGEYVETRKEDININELKENSRFTKSYLHVNVKMHNLVSGDFNNDGLTDFAYYGDPAGLYIVYQKKSVTDNNNTSLIWENAQKIKINDGLNYSNSLICDDINDDGKDDIIMGARNGVYVILQTHENKLDNPKLYPISENVLWIKVYDLNVDNLKDLIVFTNETENNIKLRLGVGAGKFGPVSEFTIERPIGIDFDKSNMFTIERQSGRLSCHRYKENIENNATDLGLTLYPLEDSDQKDKRDITIGDFNGDKLDDIVISYPSSANIEIYQQSNDGKIQNPRKFPAYSDITSIHAAQLDSDKQDELIILSTSEKTVGISNYVDGRFEFPSNVELPGEPMAILPSYVDNDKTVDCFYIYRDTNDIYYMDVIYKFGLESQKKANLKLKIEDLQSNPQGLFAVDVNRDKLQDLIVFINPYTSPVMVLQSAKDKFQVVDNSQTGISALENVKLSGTSVSDLEKHSKQELLVAYGNYARNIVFKDSKWKVIDQYNARNSSTNIDSAIAFDTDADNTKEILLFDGSNSTLEILAANLDNTYRFKKEYNIGQWQLKKILPFKIGGNKTLLLFDGAKFAILQRKSYESGFELLFSYESKIRDAKYARLAVGDINHDKIKDIALIDYVKNNIEIIALNDTYQPVPAFRFKVFEQKTFQRQENRPIIEPREILISDITNDNLNDLLIIVHDRLILYPQDK